MKKTFSEKEKGILLLAKSLLLFFFAGLFLFIDIKINGFDIFHDLLGYLFAIAGVFNLLSGRHLLEKNYRVVSWILSAVVCLSFVGYIVGLALLGQTSMMWNHFVSIFNPLFTITFVYVGYGIAEKFDKNMLVHWKKLFFIYFVLFLVFIGLYIAPFVSSAELLGTLERYDGYTLPFELFVPLLVVFIILAVLLVIYSFAVIWGTYKHLRQGVYKK